MAIADETASHISEQEEVCYRASKGCQKWVLDSGCSHHMTGNKDLFCELAKTDRASVTFGDNRTCKI
ncbi:hypothetical protein LINGRAHAP2_LOCUS30283, partial [Linum grandiflorum]